MWELKKQQETRYFGGIADDLENGGYESLLHFLLGYEISDYEVRLVPQTQALIEQKLQTAESWMGQIVQMAEIGGLPIMMPGSQSKLSARRST